VGKVFCHGFVSGLSLQNRVKSPEKTFQQVTSFLPENVFMAMILCSLGYPSEIRCRFWIDVSCPAVQTRAITTGSRAPRRGFSLSAGRGSL
jgi:hypothetical protein